MLVITLHFIVVTKSPLDSRWQIIQIQIGTHIFEVNPRLNLGFAYKIESL